MNLLRTYVEDAVKEGERNQQTTEEEGPLSRGATDDDDDDVEGDKEI